MIPIQNIYYLLLYAWDALEEADFRSLGVEPETSVLDLLAAVLNRGLDRLLRHGLDRAYLARREPIAAVRGRLDVSGTVKAGLVGLPRVVCEFDDLTHDILPNRILKASVGRLLRTVGLDTRLRAPLRSTWHRMHEVSDVHLTDRTFRLVQIHRNNRPYRLLLDICRLLLKCLIPNERSDRLTFRDFIRDEKRMRVLFERFVRNFYRRHAAGYAVESQRLRWEETTGRPEDLRLLPTMRTDVSLICPGRVLVIDAKYYREPLQQYRGRKTVRSSHLYQMFAYLTNTAVKSGRGTTVEGILLYPLTALALDLTYRVHGFRVGVRTIDLVQRWEGIHKDLLALLV